MEKPADYSELLRIAKSPAGQKLLTLLQQSGGSQLETAMEKAAHGDYSLAKQELAALLDTPEAKRLLGELGGGL